MEKEIISKRMFLILSILCIMPGLLFFIRVFFLGPWQELPVEHSVLMNLAILTLIGPIVCVLIAYYFYRKKYLLKVS